MEQLFVLQINFLSERNFSLRKINMEQLFPLDIRFFILQFWKNLKINMEQLFALQMDVFCQGRHKAANFNKTL